MIVLINFIYLNIFFNEELLKVLKYIRILSSKKFNRAGFYFEDFLDDEIVFKNTFLYSDYSIMENSKFKNNKLYILKLLNKTKYITNDKIIEILKYCDFNEEIIFKAKNNLKLDRYINPIILNYIKDDEILIKIIESYKDKSYNYISKIIDRKYY